MPSLRLLVVGASQGTGALTVSAALARGHGRYVKQAEIAPIPGSISRADVADFLVTAAHSDDWVGKAVQIGG
jgi:hypothetical protein